MKSKSVFLVAGVVLIASASALVARVLMRPPPPVTIIKEVPAVRPVVFRVLSLQRDLLPGEFIDGSVLTWVDVEEKDLRASHISVRGDGDVLALERSVYGATSRQFIRSGVPLTRDMLVRPGEPGFIAAVLSPGMRAVSIPTSAVASNAGLVAAGDWVDVILSLDRNAPVTAPVTNNSNTAGTGNSTINLAAQTILHHVRVLALNSSADSIAPQTVVASDAATELKKRGQPSRQVFETITLEVTPQAAEQLAVAREVGMLQMSLRGVKDQNTASEGTDHSRAKVDSVGRKVTRLSDATAIFVDANGNPATVQTFQGQQQGSIVFPSAP